MSRSGYSPIPFADVAMTGRFWSERLDTVLKRTIPSQHAKLEEIGILASLKLPQPPPPLSIPLNDHGFSVQVFWDSDVGKWIEAASYALAHRRDEAIEGKIDAIVEDLAKAQRPDGYLNCWYNGRVQSALARRDARADVCDRRPGAASHQRRFHRGLRSAERDRLCGNLRYGRAQGNN